MRWSDFKYLLAFLPPLATAWGIHVGGSASFAGLGVGFVLIPVLDLLSPASTENSRPEEEPARSASRGFDVLLYLNLPILYLLVGFFLSTLHSGTLSALEKVGMSLSVGLMIGTSGINVAHELGHRVGTWPQRAAQALLLPALYLHFLIEHNRGHHRNVATPEDPATSRLNESVYAFWIRSIGGSWTHAWALEKERLQKQGQGPWTPHNQMLKFLLPELLYLSAVAVAGGPWLLFSACAIALFGILMLETVNYIEHYGLRRRLLPDGRYEPVNPSHSWNSNHEAGRLVLYELSRHSDHHYKASRKFQVLRHFPQSPQLPYGYPASIVLSLLPPLWFAVMNPEVAAWESPEI